jgi:hypothetical protein
MILLAPLIALAAALQPAPDPQTHEEDSALAFDYGWPAAADDVPGLQALLRADMEAQRADARRYVAESQANARENGVDFIPHYFEKFWQTAGATPRLLSLTASESASTGGAHGNQSFDALLWDLASDRRVAAAQLLGERGLQGMRERYCRALDAERSERRDEPVPARSEDQFWECPPLAEQAIAPADGDGNGRFDRLEVLLAPYVAGPYAEGAYSVEVPFEARDLARVDARFRPAFELAGAPAAAAICPEGDMDLPRGPGDVCIGRDTGQYRFAFAWPVTAARIAPLDAILRDEARRHEDWMRVRSALAWAERAEAGGEEYAFQYEEGWSLDAALPELVAASGAAQAYTGGAHGGMAFYSLLLDRRTGTRLELEDLFTDPEAGLAAVQASLCPALAAEVLRRRGEGGAEHECPAAAAYPVTLVCGAAPRIDLMVALFNPYVVGSWVEGPYDIAFPVTPRILAALKPEYRTAFVARTDTPEQPPTESRC